MTNERQTRRRLLELLLASSGALATSPLQELLAQAPMRPETPNTIVGPFYPLVKPKETDGDLTIIGRGRQRAAGEVIQLTGRVLNRHGEPVRKARVELWQANTHGRYAHGSDPYTEAPLDPNFQGFGVQETDRDGYYRFTTIKPGPYPSLGGGWRAPHIHFDIRGRVDRKTTQLFFPGEPLNDQDHIFNSARRNRDGLVARLTRGAAGELLVTWDIVIAQG
jgi:protocatechuate 3,4-dioxygenase, beta subunit